MRVDLEHVVAYAYSVARAHGASHMDAEDLANEIAYEATQKDPDKVTLAWIGTAARNDARDKGRRRITRQNAESHPKTAQHTRAQIPTEDIALREDIRAAVAALPAKERELIERVYFQGATPAELAQEEVVAPLVIWSRLYEARRLLRNSPILAAYRAK